MRTARFLLQGPLIACGALVGVAVLAFVVSVAAGLTKLYRVPSSAMEPTIHCARPALGCEARFSDRVIVCRWCFWFHGPRRGDIVAFHPPAGAEQVCGSGGVFLKRVIGLPGERLSEQGGYVYINGKKLDEPYLKAGRRDSETHVAVKIPPHAYYLMGDNRPSSCDSRRWGTTTRSSIIGKMVATYWPPSRISIR